MAIDGKSAPVDPGLARLRELVAAANAERRPVQLKGGGTKGFYGNPLVTADGSEPLPIDCRESRGIVDYEPTELVITARCGTSMDELVATLAEQRQYLPFEPPRFGDGATVGGTVAAGLSGPRRMAAGALRDYVLGSVLLTARGDVLAFGGQVMKNVAGYDVSRLLAGSLGVLGLIAEVSLKVLPLPPVERTRRLELSEAEAIRRCNQWGGEPLPLSATLWQDGVLWVRLSGAGSAITAAERRIGGEPVGETEAAALWQGVRDQTLPSFTEQPILWRLSLPSATPPLEIAGSQLIEWGGALRWYAPPLDDHTASQTLRDLVARVGGTATLWRASPRARVARFHPLDPVLRQIHVRLKDAFDPNRIFNPGRLYEFL